MSETSANTTSPVFRQGVVAVVRRHEQFLVIRRATGVLAPGQYCFPGGGIEPGETEAAALCREMQEELAVDIRPGQCIWRSTTPWGIALAWWTGEIDADAALRPNPAEVESVHWLSSGEMLRLAELLESNRLFLDALAAGRFSLI